MVYVSDPWASILCVSQLMKTIPCIIKDRTFSPVAAGGPQNGDIRLADGTATKGRLEVYLDGVWGTVCYDPEYYTVWEKGAARAACRQLGFNNQINVGSVVDLG